MSIKVAVAAMSRPVVLNKDGTPRKRRSTREERARQASWEREREWLAMGPTFLEATRPIRDGKATGPEILELWNGHVSWSNSGRTTNERVSFRVGMALNTAGGVESSVLAVLQCVRDLGIDIDETYTRESTTEHGVRVTKQTLLHDALQFGTAGFVDKLLKMGLDPYKLREVTEPQLVDGKVERITKSVNAFDMQHGHESFAKTLLLRGWLAQREIESLKTQLASALAR